MIDDSVVNVPILSQLGAFTGACGDELISASLAANIASLENRKGLEMEAGHRKNRNPSLVERLTAFAVLIGFSIHGLLSPIRHDIAHFVVGAFGVAAILTFVLMAGKALLSKIKPFDFYELTMLALSVAIVALAGGFIYYSMASAAFSFIEYLIRLHLDRMQAASLIATSTLTFGFLAYLVRQKLRVFYGMFEVATGVFVAGYKTWDENVSSLQLSSGLFIAILTAGVYLVVRGIDNIQIGRNQKPTDSTKKIIEDCSRFIRGKWIQSRKYRKSETR